MPFTRAPSGSYSGSETTSPATRLRCLVLEDPRSVALGNEPVRVGGEPVGRVTTGGYGFTVGRSIAYAHLPPDLGPGTEVEVDLFGRRVAGEVVSEPLYDPEGARVKGIAVAGTGAG